MNKRESLRNFKTRLEKYRANLASLRLREADYGLNVPTEITSELRLIRENIAWHKYKIRELGGKIDDHFDDDPDGSFMRSVTHSEKRKAKRNHPVTLTRIKRRPVQNRPNTSLNTASPDNISAPTQIGASSQQSEGNQSQSLDTPAISVSSVGLQTAIVRSKIGIITALTEETVAFKAMLDDIEDYDVPGRGSGRRYIFGTIPARGGGKHHVVVTQAGMGNNQAAARGTLLLERFSNVTKIIMVGIAGGFPNIDKPSEHVRLGDVVISNEYGVVQYDFVKEEPRKTKVRAYPRPPSASLLEAVGLLQEFQMEGKQPWVQFIESAVARLGEKWQQPKEDILHDAKGAVVPHPPGTERERYRPNIFKSAIASANTLLKNPRMRDRLRDKFNAKAAEMEASGIADATWDHEVGYLAVRGICDYCNPAKGDAWHNYAAIVAAAYTRALLACVPPKKLSKN